MPRARSQVVTIIHQLATTRLSIQSLNETLADPVRQYQYTQL